MKTRVRATLIKYGWRPIVSEAQAVQLLRHELKHHAKWRQRNPDKRVDDYQRLLQFKPGNWYKFLKNRHNSYASILIWIR